MIKVIVENDPKQIERERLARRLDKHARELTANLMRISRGAGKPEMVEFQCEDLLNTIREHEEKAGIWSSAKGISRAINISRDYVPGASDAELLKKEGFEIIMRGALQLAASKLLDQGITLRNAEKQIFNGIHYIEEWRKEIKSKSDRRLRRKKASTKKNDDEPKL